MKRLIIYIFVVTGVSCIVSAVFYFNLYRLEIKKKTYVNKTFSYIRHSVEKNDILFVGSSRVWVHIDPVKIEKQTGLRAYNLALDGSGLPEHRAMIARYLKIHPAPKFIVLNVDFLCFDAWHETYNFPEYFHLMNDSVIGRYLKPYNVKYRSSPRKIVYALKWLSSMPDEDKLASLFKQQHFDVDAYKSYKGFNPVNRMWDKEAVEKLKLKFKPNLTPEGFRIFNDIVSICNQKNIKLIAVIAPFYKKYTSIVINAKESMNKIKLACKKKRVKVWDLSTLPLSDTTLYFYNSTHLNAKGAAIYTDSLSQRIKKEIGVGQH
ncbi:MAG TPA: hypothetical protein VK177_02680 [Flavobacteriales bacterium]|nr:hypothetical protein [Flavobacteriales bacterium]